jgi:hypothetical protein
MTIRANNQQEITHPAFEINLGALAAFLSTNKSAREEFEALIIELLNKDEHASAKMATLASHVLSDPNSSDIEKRLAGSVLSNAKDKTIRKVIGRYVVIKDI